MQYEVRRVGSYHEHQRFVRLGTTPRRANIDIVSDTSLRTQEGYEVVVVMTVQGPGNAPIQRMTYEQVGTRQAIWQSATGRWTCARVARIPGPLTYVNLSGRNLISASFGRILKVDGVSAVPIHVRSRSVLGQEARQVVAATLYVEIHRTLPLRESVFFKPPDGPGGRLRAREWGTADFSRWGEKVSVKLPIRCP